MSSWAARQAIAETNNPSSPYFIGGPSVPEHIRNVLNSGRYKTNYFGSSAKGILAQPNSDCVQFENKISLRRRNSDIMKLVGVAAASVLGFLLFRKLPYSGWTLKTVGKVLKAPFHALKYVGKAFAWLCRGSKT